MGKCVTITCSIGSVHILNEPRTTPQHATSRRNKENKPDWSKTVFVEREKHWRANKIKEAVLINAVNPTKNVQSGGIMNLEKGY